MARQDEILEDAVEIELPSRHQRVLILDALSRCGLINTKRAELKNVINLIDYHDRCYLMHSRTANALLNPKHDGRIFLNEEEEDMLLKVAYRLDTHSICRTVEEIPETECDKLFILSKDDAIYYTIVPTWRNHGTKTDKYKPKSKYLRKHKGRSKHTRARYKECRSI